MAKIRKSASKQLLVLHGPNLNLFGRSRGYDFALQFALSSALETATKERR